MESGQIFLNISEFSCAIIQINLDLSKFFFKLFYQSMKNIAETLKKALLEKGWSQKKLVAEIGMTENGFKAMLDSGSMKLSTLYKICEVLELNPNYFFADNKNNKDLGDSDYLVNKLNEIEQMFKEQISIKDRQIEKLLDILGKADGVSIHAMLPQAA